jgi:hypothetical protein
VRRHGCAWSYSTVYSILYLSYGQDVLLDHLLVLSHQVRVLVTRDIVRYIVSVSDLNMQAFRLRTHLNGSFQIDGKVNAVVVQSSTFDGDTNVRPTVRAANQTHPSGVSALSWCWGSELAQMVQEISLPHPRTNPKTFWFITTSIP